MKIGFDYWNVISHYPAQIGEMIQAFAVANAEGSEHECYVISAIGAGRKGTIEKEVFSVLLVAGYESDVLFKEVHEVVFKNPKESPALKLAKAQELGLDVFFDDRQDVCDLMNANGILAFTVPRQIKKTDVGAERV